VKYLHIFAADYDVLPVVESVERAMGPLQYIVNANLTNPDFKTFLSGADIPNLGKAESHAGAGCSQFFVTKASISIGIEKIEGLGGVQRYCLSQFSNPDTVVFQPAGRWGEDCVLQGVVSTISETSLSQELMRRFLAGFGKSFTKVREFWVGPRALALLKAGKRLTAAANSPPEYDVGIALLAWMEKRRP
jgi:hypothetical protein